MAPRPKRSLPVVPATARSVALEAIARALRVRPVERGLPYVQSYGGGVDSVYILERFLREPGSQPFDAADFVVVMAQTGDEFTDTRDFHSRIVLPDMRAHGIRFVQVARTRAGVESSRVLEDSREPTDLLIDGDYRLSDEMHAAGTLPTTAGDRVCSQRSKGAPIDRTIREYFRIEGRFVHAFGFDRDEVSRIAKCEAAIAERNLRRAGALPPQVSVSIDDPWWLDAPEATAFEIGDYPMLRWDTSREAAIAWLERELGETAPRSCCRACPFQKPWSDPTVVERWRHEPAERIARDLLMEHRALAFNFRIPLFFRQGSLRSFVERAQITGALDAFRADLDEREHALWRVRRIYRASPSGRVVARRSTERVQTGSAAEMNAVLDAHVARGCRLFEEHGIRYAFRRDREPDGERTSEEFFVVAPADADEKVRGTRFEQSWLDAHPDSTGPEGCVLQPSLFAGAIPI